MKKMLQALALLALACLTWIGQLRAQGQELSFRGVERITHQTFDFDKDGQAVLSIRKQSWFDTAQVLLRQERFHYVKTDTGLYVIRRYSYQYNPETRLGSYYTETFPNPLRSNPGTYSKQETEFRSFDHESKREWIKQYDKDKKIIKETRHDYDSLGNLIRSFIRDHSFSPPNEHIDEVRRNAQGQMVFWEAYDQDDLGRRKVRETRWEYLQDTLVAKQFGYLHNSWTEIQNRYDKQGRLTKTTMSSGLYSNNRKPTIDDKIETVFKEGKPQMTTTWRLGKKVSTLAYKYKPEGITEEILTEGKTKNVKLTQEVRDPKGRLAERRIRENNSLKEEEFFRYQGKHLRQHQAMEYRNNGDKWFTVNDYNERGYPTKRLFRINNQPKQQDLYEYNYYPHIPADLGEDEEEAPKAD